MKKLLIQLALFQIVIWVNPQPRPLFYKTPSHQLRKELNNPYMFMRGDVYRPTPIHVPYQFQGYFLQ